MASSKVYYTRAGAIYELYTITHVADGTQSAPILL